MPLPARYFVLRLESGKCELPPSMMMSPASRRGSRVSIQSSTGLPAWTRSMTRRGRFSLETNSSTEWAPTMDLPLASLARKASTLDTVRLNAQTV